MPQLFIWSGVVALIVGAYLTVWGYVNRDNAIRCEEQRGTPTQVGIHEFGKVWRYFNAPGKHCTPGPSRK